MILFGLFRLRLLRVVVLDSGRVESQGTHDELLARSPLYAALWAEQQRANGWKIKPEASPRP